MSECPRKSVGAFIEKVEDGVLKILLIDRVNEPHGWAGVAGHLDEGKTPEGMILIEIGEEVGLQGFEESAPVHEEMVPWNYCWRNKTDGHYWYLFKLRQEKYGEISIESDEVKGFGWFTPREIEHLNLEPVWRHWFLKLGYIKE